MPPKVAIIILNWNGLKDTIECLESLKKMDYPRYEIVVVDNASNDGSPEKLINLFPGITLLQNKENLGYAGGNNIGMRHALENGAQYVWLLNNDTIVEADTISKLIARAEKNPKIGLLSPVIYFYANPSIIQHCGNWIDYKNYNFVELKDLNDYKDFAYRQICLWGTALFIKREVIEKIGMLNEKYFAYYEDAEYSLRALNAGFENRIELSAKIFHKNDYEGKEAIRNLPPHYFFYMTRNRYWFWKNNIKCSHQVVFLMKYLSKIINRIAYFAESKNYPKIDACLDGIYCAFLDIGGKWDPNRKMPNFFKRIILSHPYFLSYLLEGDFKRIFIKRKQKFMHNYG